MSCSVFKNSIKKNNKQQKTLILSVISYNNECYTIGVLD